MISRLRMGQFIRFFPRLFIVGQRVIVTRELLFGLCLVSGLLHQQGGDFLYCGFFYESCTGFSLTEGVVLLLRFRWFRMVHTMRSRLAMALDGPLLRLDCSCVVLLVFSVIPFWTVLVNNDIFHDKTKSTVGKKETCYLKSFHLYVRFDDCKCHPEALSLFKGAVKAQWNFFEFG